MVNSVGCISVRCVFVTIMALQLVAVVEREVFDFLGFMWTSIVLNLIQIIFIIVGLFGAAQYRHRAIITYMVSCILWVGWNIFVICFYLQIGSLQRDSSVLNMGGGGKSWWSSHGVGCYLNTTVSNAITGGTQSSGTVVQGCLIEYYYVEVLHAAIQCLLSILGLSLAGSTLRTALKLHNNEPDESVADELEYIRMQYESSLDSRLHFVNQSQRTARRASASSVNRSLPGTAVTYVDSTSADNPLSPSSEVLVARNFNHSHTSAARARHTVDNDSNQSQRAGSSVLRERSDLYPAQGEEAIYQNVARWRGGGGGEGQRGACYDNIRLANQESQLVTGVAHIKQSGCDGGKVADIRTAAKIASANVAMPKNSIAISSSHNNSSHYNPGFHSESPSLKYSTAAEMPNAVISTISDVAVSASLENSGVRVPDGSRRLSSKMQRLPLNSLNLVTVEKMLTSDVIVPVINHRSPLPQTNVIKSDGISINHAHPVSPRINSSDLTLPAFGLSSHILLTNRVEPKVKSPTIMNHLSPNTPLSGETTPLVDRLNTDLLSHVISCVSSNNGTVGDRRQPLDVRHLLIDSGQRRPGSQADSQEEMLTSIRRPQLELARVSPEASGQQRVVPAAVGLGNMPEQHQLTFPTGSESQHLPYRVLKRNDGLHPDILRPQLQGPQPMTFVPTTMELQQPGSKQLFDAQETKGGPAVGLTTVTVVSDQPEYRPCILSTQAKDIHKPDQPRHADRPANIAMVFVRHSSMPRVSSKFVTDNCDLGQKQSVVKEEIIQLARLSTDTKEDTRSLRIESPPKSQQLFIERDVNKALPHENMIGSTRQEVIIVREKELADRQQKLLLEKLQEQLSSKQQVEQLANDNEARQQQAEALKDGQKESVQPQQLQLQVQQQHYQHQYQQQWQQQHPQYEQQQQQQQLPQQQQQQHLFHPQSHPDYHNNSSHHSSANASNVNFVSHLPPQSDSLFSHAPVNNFLPILSHSTPGDVDRFTMPSYLRSIPVKYESTNFNNYHQLSYNKHEIDIGHIPEATFI